MPGIRGYTTLWLDEGEQYSEGQRTHGWKICDVGRLPGERKRHIVVWGQGYDKGEKNCKLE